MNPADLHFRSVAVLRRLPNRWADDLVVLEGVAWFDGDAVEIRPDSGPAVSIVLTDAEVAAAMPVTGALVARLAGVDYYVVREA